jgi:PAS domain S-box-containing protein
MQLPKHVIRQFLKGLGPVEQAQIVASTAVVVMMGTILTALLLTQQTVRLMDFMSILTVGVIGFTSVYFTLRYGRQLDAQRRQLLALNTIADAVNRFPEINTVLRTSLSKVTELLGSNLGWIYLLEGDHLVLKSVRGTDLDFLALHGGRDHSPTFWVRQPRVQRERVTEHQRRIHPRMKELGIQFWASIPLTAKDTVAGILVLAWKEYTMLSATEAELMESFGKQISIALNNARLFELLRQSEQEYHDLFEHAPDCYMTVDRNRVIVGCNRTGEEVFGYPRKQILGKRFEEFCVEENEGTVREMLDTLFETGKGVSDVEERIVSRSGEPLFVNLNISLAFNEEGKPINARVIARDITQKKNMEHAIIHAQKIDSIGKLAGGVAHDFNNILASILGSASIMRRRLTEKAKLYKYVEIIEIAARRGSSLTRQLLTFARKTETRDETVDVNGIIKETLHLFERSIPKDIVVRLRLTDDVTNIRGDSGQVQQAFLNLLLNARDAMPNGGHISVTSEVLLADAHTTSQFTSVKPGPFVRVSVSDIGTGIDKTTQSRIFEPFFTTKDTGTGLGLSVLYGVVQNHGGFVDVQSELGSGTTISMYLPRESGFVQGVMRQRRKQVPRGTEHILIIDDEISVCEIAGDLLSELGYVVARANDGQAGVDLYRSRQGTIDLVLLDLDMPLMGGKETFEHLRSINPGLRIIILTGYGEDVLEEAGFTSEVDSYLQKPFQLEDLALKIREVLDSRRPATEFAN